MRAIKIDPVARTIEVINLEKNPNTDLSEVRKLVGRYIEIVDIDREISLLCDEEGRLKDIRGAFMFYGCPEMIICGTAIVIGTDGHGGFTDLEEGLWSFELGVEWVDPADVPPPRMTIMSIR